ncbi:MAG: PEGA domain-containing protein [Myxococcales bacterium]|nr:PEGA domain-containing protein [Myxococcales bacterium]
MIRTRFTLAFALALSALAAPLAHAQDRLDVDTRVLLLPALGTEALRDGPGALAVDAVRRALEAAGWVPEAPESDVRQIIRDCPDTTTCTQQLLAAAGLREAIFTTVWAVAGTDQVREVIVAFEDDEGRQSVGQAEVEGDDVPNAARRAFARALSERRGEHLVALRVRGTPVGAGVTVDGEPIGTLPVDTERRRGEVEIAVSARGYRTERRRVQLDEPAEVEFALQLGDEGSTPVTRRRPWYALVLAGAGAVGVATTLAATLPGLGCGQVGEPCKELRPGPFAIYLGLSAAALVGGVLWFALGGSSERGTELGLSPGGLRLRHTF